MCADPRVADWLLMDSYTPTLLLTAGYLLVVALGPRLMTQRPALHAPRLLFVYNMFLVAVNFHIFYEVRHHLASHTSGKYFEELRYMY